MLRLIGILTALVALVAGGGMAVMAQDATPMASASPLAALGYPELRITFSDDGVEAPDEVPAGRYLVTVEAAGQADADVLFLQLPAGVSEADAEEAIAAAEDEEAPAFLYEWTFAGGLFVPAGGADRLVLDLAPGDWFITAETGEEEGEAGGTPVPADALRPLTVTGDGGTPPADQDPAADATIEMQEYAFVGLPDGVEPGRQVWQVTNTGEQPHHIVLFRSPQPITLDQVMTLLQLPEGATPPPDLGIDLQQIEEAGGVHILSPDRTVWAEMDLSQPGTYVALCFVPDRESGMPHALMGMVGIFTVGEAGTEGATPDAG